MELALALLRLWERRRLLALGIVLAVLAGVAASIELKSTVYAAAQTQMVVDAPRSALGNLQTSLLPFTNRAVVYARLMTSPQALQYIGQAAGVPGTQIAAQGPAEIGAPQATHTPTAMVDGKLVAPTAKYVLRFDQNPQLPTVDIFSQAPTSQKAIAMANGVVTGFAAYLDHLETQTGVPESQRVTIRQLGGAQGGVVDGGSAKQLGALIAVIVLLVWCAGMLYIARLKSDLRDVRSASETDPLRARRAPAPAETLPITQVDATKNGQLTVTESLPHHPGVRLEQASGRKDRGTAGKGRGAADKGRRRSTVKARER